MAQVNQFLPAGTVGRAPPSGAALGPASRARAVQLMLLLIGLGVLLIGCGDTENLETNAVDIRGNIAEVYHTNGDDAVIGAVMIEGAVEADTRYDRASITITDQTAIFARRGGERVPITFDQVAVGQRAEARFAGPVRETYPYQGTAAELVILSGD